MSSMRSTKLLGNKAGDMMINIHSNDINLEAYEAGDPNELKKLFFFSPNGEPLWRAISISAEKEFAPENAAFLERANNLDVCSKEPSFNLKALTNGLRKFFEDEKINFKYINVVDPLDATKMKKLIDASNLNLPDSVRKELCRAMININDLITQHPELKNKTLSDLINTDPIWADAYEALQKAFTYAFLTIANLVRGNLRSANLIYLENLEIIMIKRQDPELGDLLVDAKELINDFQKQLVEISNAIPEEKSGESEYPLIKKAVENCQKTIGELERLTRLDNFIKDSPEFKERREFQVKFLQLANDSYKLIHKELKNKIIGFSDPKNIKKYAIKENVKAIQGLLGDLSKLSAKILGSLSEEKDASLNFLEKILSHVNVSRSKKGALKEELAAAKEHKRKPSGRAGTTKNKHNKTPSKNTTQIITAKLSANTDSHTTGLALPTVRPRASSTNENARRHSKNITGSSSLPTLSEAKESSEVHQSQSFLLPLVDSNAFQINPSSFIASHARNSTHVFYLDSDEVPSLLNVENNGSEKNLENENKQSGLSNR